MPVTRIFLSSSAQSPWIVPGDWNQTVNTIECIGGGGGGGSVSTTAPSGANGIICISYSASLNTARFHSIGSGTPTPTVVFGISGPPVSINIF